MLQLGAYITRKQFLFEPGPWDEDIFWLWGADPFHETHNPPQKAGVCDHDGSELYQRDDDKAETVINRITVYFAQTAPLIEYYQQGGQLLEIDGTQPIEQVTTDLLAALAKKV